MNNSPSWHLSTLQHITEQLRPDLGVRALLVVGSVVYGSVDEWSDLDIVVVVADEQLARFFPTRAWLEQLGTVFAYEQFPGQERATTRVCFTDGRRIDAAIVTESSLAEEANWPFALDVRVCFSRSPIVDGLLSKPNAPPLFHPATAEQFETLVNQFWFKAVVAVNKVVRGDLLIALHLCLDVMEDACVLAMMLRDRATSTTIHKTGGLGNEIVARLHAPGNPPSALSILDSLAGTGRLFDTLAGQWSPLYEERQQLFLIRVAQARTAITQLETNRRHSLIKIER
ncbi:MAG: aminoglycoside 6-adenylyltransferase [Caldilineaceae bacterium]